ncbi:MAG: tRNA (guanosine(46)-N7)-methyltransferase TrmB [Deltaproteobacteria bacterium CG11_big_fil_rev_8_21_14_0_20_47_16]|nr:MAG: tRNA (guanosine(46)-N7)-methyltransferase TrmB [Deltaproteobacteria bacterium CG11_big_fil_rev_8_21_14_0_20_47_16]
MNDYLPHVYRDPLWCYPAQPQSSDGRIIVEIGPGRGDFLFHLASQHPNALVCGIELMHERFDKLCVRREKNKLENVWLIQGDARRVLPEVFREGVHEIHIWFPDPWPKRKHFKNRLIQTPFVQSCADALIPNGVLYFTTDWCDYAEWTADIIATNDRFESLNHPAISTDDDGTFPSYFYQKWRAMGRNIYSQKYKTV